MPPKGVGCRIGGHRKLIVRSRNHPTTSILKHILTWLDASAGLREAQKAIQIRENQVAKECEARTFHVIKWAKPTASANSAMMLRDTCCVPEFRQMRRLLLSADNRLLTVVHDNIIRGLVSNALHLGYTWDTVCQDDSLSSFCAVAHGGIAVLGKVVHPKLKPTTLQRHVIHHPWLDLIPSAQFRDNILRATLEWADAEKDFETDLCKDLTGAGELQLSCARPGLMVWGDPCDSASWEMSDEFACKWPEIVDGCWDIIYSTNYWRKSRGEPPL